MIRNCLKRTRKKILPKNFFVRSPFFSCFWLAFLKNLLRYYSDRWTIITLRIYGNRAGSHFFIIKLDMAPNLGSQTDQITTSFKEPILVKQIWKCRLCNTEGRADHQIIKLYEKIDKIHIFLTKKTLIPIAPYRHWFNDH